MSKAPAENFDISKVDKNFATETTNGKEVVWYDVNEPPFAIYGLLRTDDGSAFCRLPQSLAEDPAVNEGVRRVYTHAAGGRVRFSTDSRYVFLRYEYSQAARFSHMPLTGSLGFDLYVDNDYDSIFLRCCNLGEEKENEMIAVPPSFDCRGMHSYTLNFPLFTCVKRLWVGIAPGAKLEAGKDYRPAAPMVFYGSGVAQGACVCRPGNAYPAMVSRWLNCDHVNLGLSGSCLGEEKIMEHIARLHPSVFVYDYDRNAPDARYLQQTHERGYRIFRKENPHTPVIFLSAPAWEESDPSLRENRPVVFETYSKALAEGDMNIAFVDGNGLFAGRERFACTVDGIHPGDLGTFRIAEAVADAAEPFFRNI